MLIHNKGKAYKFLRESGQFLAVALQSCRIFRFQVCWKLLNFKVHLFQKFASFIKKMRCCGDFSFFLIFRGK